MEFLSDRDQITKSFVSTFLLPHLPDVTAEVPFRLFGNGWDNFALEVGQYVVRLPKDEGAVPKLVLEQRISKIVKNPHLMTPDLTFIADVEYPFAFHRTIPGDVLLEDQYLKLADEKKDALAAKIAGFFQHMHSTDLDLARGCGVTDGYPHITHDQFVEWYPKLASVLDERKFGQFLKYYETILADADDQVFGHFDVHGWNMAFDHQTGILNGIFDFGESCIDKRHLDFWPPNTLSPDLARRVTLQYVALTGIPINLSKINMYTLLDEYSNAFGMFIEEGKISTKALAQIDRWWSELTFI